MSKYVVKIFVACVLFIGAIFAFPLVIAYAQSPSISINGERIEIPADVEQPVIINGRTLVPMYPVMEQLGFLVIWREHAQSIILSRLGHTVITAIGRYSLMYQEEGVQMGASARIINGHVMLPIRAISETTGLQVRWNADTFTVEISGYMPAPRDPVPTIQREIDGISLDMTPDELEELLRSRGLDPERRFYGEESQGGHASYYSVGGMWFGFNSVGGFSTASNTDIPSLMTDNGIGLGDSRERVIEVYGNHFLPSPFGGRTIEYFDGELYLFISFNFDGVVSGWGIGTVSVHDSVLRHHFGL